MTRTIKVLFVCALVATSIGAISASNARSGTEPTFTNHVEGEVDITYKIAKDTDGGTKPATGHMQLDIRKADGTGVLTLTCNELTGDATVPANERQDATFVTPSFEGGGKGTNCLFNNIETAVSNTGCDFTFTANKIIHIENEGKNLCEAKQKPIHFSIPNCKVEIGKQTITGIDYHNQVGGTVTVEIKDLAFEYTATGTACPYGTTKNGLFTTGNMILQANKKGGTEEPVEISWDE